MKKIQGLTGIFPVAPRSFPRGAILASSAALGLLASAVLAGCGFFASTEYSDVDYTASVQFDRFVGSDAAVPAAPATGSWDCGYRYADWDGYSYLTLSGTGLTVGDYATADGLDPGSTVYRLEVANLIDGGNFEASGGAWTGAGSAAWWTSTAPLFGSGCVKVDLDLNESVTYATVARAGFAGFSTTATYNLFFRYTSATDKAMFVVDASPTTQALNPTGAGEKGYARYTINNGYATAPVIQFNPIDDTSTLYDFYVDNFRVGRSGNMTLRLLLAPTDTIALSGASLGSGTYSFSVWAYSDPLATTVQSPYPVEAFAVKMVAAAGTIDLSSTTATYAEASGWQKLTATLEPGALTYVDDTTEAVLGLELDFNQTRPGSVLLARPELVYHANGL